MGDKRKIIIIIFTVFCTVLLIGFALVYLYGYLTTVERPPLDVKHAKIQNYTGGYDTIDLSEFGVTFDVRSGGEIIKVPGKTIINGDKYTIVTTITPLQLISLNTNDSLKIHLNESIEYGVKRNVEITGDYKYAFNKKRGDIVMIKPGLIIRALTDSTFTDNDTPILDFEYIYGDTKEVYNIFFGYYSKNKIKLLNEKYVVRIDDKVKGLEMHTYYQVNPNTDFTYDIFGFGGVYNDKKTKTLNQKILDQTNFNFKEKYGVELEEEENKYYMTLIKKDKNKYFNKIDFERIILMGNDLYTFKYIKEGINVNISKLIEGNFDDFTIKNIEFVQKKKKMGGTQSIFKNMQFIIPDIYSEDEKNWSKTKFIYKPNGKLFRLGQITIESNRKINRKETMNDVYKKEVEQYVAESMAIKSTSISSVELIKSKKVNIGGFDGIANLFSFTTPNKNDFKFVEYILFNSKDYITVSMAYGDEEDELFKYFEDLINSINKI